VEELFFDLIILDLGVMEGFGILGSTGIVFCSFDPAV